MRLPAVSLAVLVVASFVGAPVVSAAQEDVAQPGSDETLPVFLDCGACDFDFVRRTIRFVNWVRDRQDARVHALVTTRPTGAGGIEFNLNLMGLQELEGVQEVIRFTTDQTNTQQEVRESLTHTLELGLARFVAGTELGRRIQLVFEPDASDEVSPAEPEDDPWSFWVFSVGLDGFFSGQETTKSASIGGSLSANRTTKDWKIRFSGTGTYSRSSFELSENEDFVSITSAYRARALVVRSVGDHWSVGFRSSGNTSTFSNTKRAMRLAPAIEYSVFPYSESSERDLRILYSAGVNALDYTEETLFRVTEETLYDQNLSVTLDLIQSWGSAQVALEASVFLNDLSGNRVSLSGGSDWRVFRGLSLLLFGSVARIADQRNIPAGDASDEDILLRRLELLTSFDYSISLGFAYTFGSKFANVVNPRFGS